jgi:hypothetical protein
MLSRLHARAQHPGRQLHHINRQRLTALILIATGLARVGVWVTLIGLYLAGVAFTTSLFQSVAFVAVISLYANAATDFGQVCASLAQLTAGDAHHDAQAARHAIHRGTAVIEADIARLADLQPGPEAAALATQIRQQLAERNA